jgi:hypothetical protein
LRRLIVTRDVEGKTFGLVPRWTRMPAGFSGSFHSQILDTVTVASDSRKIVIA